MCVRQTQSQEEGDGDDGRIKLLVREVDRAKGKDRVESAALALLLVSRFWLSFCWAGGSGGACGREEEE